MFNKQRFKKDFMKSLKKHITQDNISNQNNKSTSIKEKMDFDYDLIHSINNKYRCDSVKFQPTKNSLSYLVYHNKLKELETKLKNGIDPDHRDICGESCSWTPLYWSVKLRNIECTKILLKFGASINLVINDFDECCGTVLDLAILREDDEMEKLLRDFAEQEDVNLGQSFKAIRSKLRGKAPAFNFKYYGKKKEEAA